MFTKNIIITIIAAFVAVIVNALSLKANIYQSLTPVLITLIPFFVFIFFEKQPKESKTEEVQPEDKEESLARSGYSVEEYQRLKEEYQILEREMEKILLKSEKLEHDSKTVEMFLASMSHEIRTPLNGIIGWTEILDDNTLTPSQKESVLMIRESSNNLRVIVNDILDVSKINAGKMELETISFDFVTKIKASVGIFASKIEEKGIDLKVSIDPKIPKYLMGDPTRLSQVVINLVSNALKFTDKGGRIDVSAESFRQEENDITFRISVSDSGIGLSKEQQHKIFEAYSQATAGTNRKSGGTGLGLTISRKIVEAMGGKLEVESQEGEGTVFFFVVTLKRAPIPKAKNIESRPTQKEPEPKQKKTERITQKINVLVAEDNLINQKLIKIVLENLGLNVTIAHNGKEAYEKRVANKYDLIFMDVQMPVLGGIESTKLILKYEKENMLKHVPIIALTANALAGDKEKYLSGGMDGYTTKPLEIPALKKIIEKYCQK